MNLMSTNSATRVVHHHQVRHALSRRSQEHFLVNT
jgi:hypothetical protein